MNDDNNEPEDPRERAREAWKDWTPADVKKELEPWPTPAAAAGADLDCWSPAVPAAIAVLNEREGSSFITIGRSQPVQPYRRVECTPTAAAQPPPAYIDGAINWCGICGQLFQVRSDDPHWATGRGPICPNRKAAP